MGPISGVGAFFIVMGCLVGGVAFWSRRHQRLAANPFLQKFADYRNRFDIGLSCFVVLMGVCALLNWERAARLILVAGCTVVSAGLAVLGPRGFFAVLRHRIHGAPVRPHLLVAATLTCECGAVLMLSVGLVMLDLPDSLQPFSTANQAFLLAIIMVLSISGAAFLLGAVATAILSLAQRVPHAPD